MVVANPEHRVLRARWIPRLPIVEALMALWQLAHVDGSQAPSGVHASIRPGTARHKTVAAARPDQEVAPSLTLWHKQVL